MELTCSFKEFESRVNRLKWKKVLPCEATGWNFSRNLKKVIETYTKEELIIKWPQVKEDIMKSSLTLRSRKVTKWKAKIRKLRRILNHLMENEPKGKFSLNWSTQWAKTFNEWKEASKDEGMVVRACSGVIWTLKGEKSSSYYLSRFKSRVPNTKLTSLKLENGNVFSIPEDL